MKQALIVGAIGLALLSSGCQGEPSSRGSEGSLASAPAAPTPSPASGERPSAQTAAFHQANLSKGETDDLAAQLVDVPGYGYGDVMALETNLAAGRLPKFFEGFSLHSVVDSSGTEVAFLQLMRFRGSRTPPDSAEGQVVHAFSVTDPTTETIGGQKVFFREDTSSTSPFAYLMYEDGVLTWADDEDRTALRAWLESYLDTLKQQ